MSKTEETEKELFCEKIKKRIYRVLNQMWKWVYINGYNLYFWSTIIALLYLTLTNINNTIISSYMPFGIAILLILNMGIYVIKIFKELDEEDPTFIDILLLIVLVIVITVFLSYFLGTIDFITYNFKPVGTQDGWLGLWGALGGGAMTLFGVWYTIRKQNEVQKENNKLHEQERKEELAVQYRPILSFDKNNIEYTQDQYKANLSDINIKIITDSNYEKLLKPMIILIDNIGRGEAIIKKIDIKSNKNNSSIFQIYTASKGDIIIGPGKSVKLAFQFDPKLFNGLNLYEVQENLSLTLTYTDLIQKNIYKTIIDMYFLLDVNAAAPPGIILESGAPLLLNSYNETITMRKSRKR